MWNGPNFNKSCLLHQTVSATQRKKDNIIKVKETGAFYKAIVTFLLSSFIITLLVSAVWLIHDQQHDYGNIRGFSNSWNKIVQYVHIAGDEIYTDEGWTEERRNGGLPLGRACSMERKQHVYMGASSSYTFVAIKTVTFVLACAVRTDIATPSTAELSLLGSRYMWPTEVT